MLRFDCPRCLATLECPESCRGAVISCPKCMEAFAGAADRKKAREDQQKQQQMMGIAQQGVSILGQVAGTPSGRNMLGQLFDMVIKSNGNGS